MMFDLLFKNVCQNIAKSDIERFRSECQRSVLTLACGGQLEDLMGEGEPLPGPVGRGQRRGRGRGKRGNAFVDPDKGHDGKKGKGKAGAQDAGMRTTSRLERGEEGSIQHVWREGVGDGREGTASW